MRPIKTDSQNGFISPELFFQPSINIKKIHPKSWTYRLYQHRNPVAIVMVGLRNSWQTAILSIVGLISWLVLKDIVNTVGKIGGN